MATVAIESRTRTAFVYEDLIDRVQVIQLQMTEMENLIDGRCQNQRKISEGLKHRSLIFIDPYSNRMINEHLDHQLISKTLEKFRQNVIPKYLQPRTQIGIRQDDRIRPAKIHGFRLSRSTGIL